MNNKQFITELAQRMGYTVQNTQKMMYQLVDAMGDAFQESTAITVPHFGVFEVRKKLERVMINPATGQRMLVPPKLTLNFKISPAWKEEIKSGGTK